MSERKSSILAPDDLEVGGLYTVHSLKGSDQPIPIAGLAFRVTAINLPFFVARLANPTVPPVTLDVRYLDFMRVSEEYAKAQAGADQPESPIPGFVLLRRPNRPA
jgi:hypothetical protein